MIDSANEPVRVRWSSGSTADRFTVEEAATGRQMALVQGCGEAEVDRAVRVADAAFRQDWRLRTGADRAQFLRRAAQRLAAHKEELARLLCRENGKPMKDALRMDLTSLVASFEFFAALAERPGGEFVDYGNLYTATVREPFGVVAAILPFNWPPIHAGAKIAPALAAGNTVVLKPGEQAPLTAIRIVELLNDVLPDDVLHVVPGAGPAAGIALTHHPLVRKISFTGSPGAGAQVLAAAAGRHVPVLLELGGKNPVVIFEDADLEQAAADCAEAAFFNKGEACTAASRILVHETCMARFVDRLCSHVRGLRVGDGLHAETEVGPLVSRPQQQKVLAHIRQAVAEGAAIAAQADLPTDPALADGFFVAPTVLTGVTPHMAAFTEEIFGPVVCVTPFGDEHEAVALANGTEFGLVAAVYTADAGRGLRVSRQIEAGIVFLNNYRRGMMGTPFGGTKASGYGREHCAATLHEYSYVKALRIPSGRGEIPGWFRA
ncbi:aldehyde dehydrogenase [Verticiella sediminum]|uniref:Aldehyde dehydrogenase n=1 Tax=Verticiella sediminum TaxID=1247510 RepID=A0A556AGN5_9BURK|nr:aldehyde dehydrogenase family protein [Verticiella sediminum]TSH92041.1 aldehyde dehydrogenase [Verticiella sediminum]